jgi:26S proteasome regulatory subunit N1
MGIALIAMGEPLGSQMASRMLEHLLQYGEPPGMSRIECSVYLVVLQVWQAR